MKTLYSSSSSILYDFDEVVVHDWKYLEFSILNLIFFIVSGLYSGRIENYTVTVPILVDEKGDALTEDEVSRRRKRSADLSNNVHYKLEIEGEEVVVELFLNSEFISPNLVIERRTKEKRTRRRVGDYLSGKIECGKE